MRESNISVGLFLNETPQQNQQRFGQMPTDQLQMTSQFDLLHPQGG